MNNTFNQSYDTANRQQLMKQVFYQQKMHEQYMIKNGTKRETNSKFNLIEFAMTGNRYNKSINKPDLPPEAAPARGTSQHLARKGTVSG